MNVHRVFTKVSDALSAWHAGESFARDYLATDVAAEPVLICGSGGRLLPGKFNFIPSYRTVASEITERVDLSEDTDLVAHLLDKCDWVTMLSIVNDHQPEMQSLVDQLLPKDWMSANLREGRMLAACLGSCGIGSLLCTDVDSVFEVAIEGEKQATYADSHFVKVAEDAAESGGAISILRSNGFWRDRHSPALWTWRDILTAQCCEPGFLAFLRKHLPGLVDPQWREEYRTRLDGCLTAVESNLPTNTKRSLDIAVQDWVKYQRPVLMVDCHPFDPAVLLLLHRQTIDEGFLPSALKTVSVLGNSQSASIDVAPEFLTTFFDGVAHVLTKGRAGRKKEKRDRWNGYLDQVNAYGAEGLASPSNGGKSLKWLRAKRIGPATSGHTGLALVPFAELWCNEKDLCTADAIKFEQLTTPRFRLEGAIAEMRDEYWRIEEERKKHSQIELVNEEKVRVSDWAPTSTGAIKLSVERVEYKDYLATNYFVGNIGSGELAGFSNKKDLQRLAERAMRPPGEGIHVPFNPIQALCRDVGQLQLENAACSNHLGVSSLLLANYYTIDHQILPVLVCPPSGDQMSSPGEIIPTVSGSVDWPQMTREDGKFMNLEDEVRREFVEECILGKNEYSDDSTKQQAARDGRDYADSLILNERVINFCQNVQRGGKPEFFFLTSLKISANFLLQRVFSPNWELKKSFWDQHAQAIMAAKRTPQRRRTELLPSPLRPNFELAQGYAEAISQLLAIIDQNDFNPVLRAHLASVIRLCEIRFPEQCGGTLEEKGM